ncbi:EamA family transporter RarD [Limoniibacter endophyticus]|uniref:Permease n=1 Tax=Limoniibacter endophyticus TaxID=1565040 RepID=A0A8J3GFT8_9HYPH|nr:EamA family transporter RarD [Limoniibacter endophyticus]GHC68922.1 permease [Limoniibacter endophyticus]
MAQLSEQNATPAATAGDTPAGFGYALAAYLSWGFLPLFMKLVAHIPSTEVVAHRIVWSLPIAGLVLLLRGRTEDLKAALRSPSILGMAVVTAVLITLNWGIYVWAIAVGRTVEAALGYYINPLFSFLLGAIVLREPMTTAQKIAIGLAAIAVVILTVDAGGLPWVSLGLCVSWGLYAFCRKTLPVGPNQGFFLEVLLLSAPALLYILYLQANGQGHFLTTSWSDAWLLAACGVITAIPLILYANGAKLLRLSTIAVMQYIVPTMVFLTAVFLFNEPFNSVKLLAFCFIWAALIIYSSSALLQRRTTGKTL